MELSILEPPAEEPGADELEQLAARANAEHEAGASATRKGLEHFRAAGQALLAAKERCGHGRFLPWLKEHVKFAARTARDYLRIAEHWDKLAAAANLRDALRLLQEGQAESREPRKLSPEVAQLFRRRKLPQEEQDALARVADPPLQLLLGRLLASKKAKRVSVAKDLVLKAAAQVEAVAVELGLVPEATAAAA